MNIQIIIVLWFVVLNTILLYDKINKLCNKIEIRYEKQDQMIIDFLKEARK